jgi:hypothetical protein
LKTHEYWVGKFSKEDSLSRDCVFYIGSWLLNNGVSANVCY